MNCWKNRDSIYIENRLNMIQKEPCDDIKSHGSFNHIKEQPLIQKQPSKSEGCFCIYARKA